MGWASRHALLARAVNQSLGGVSVTWGAVSGYAILEQNSELIIEGNVISVEYMLHNLSTDDFADLKYGDKIEVDDIAYEVREVMRVGDGRYCMARLSMEDSNMIQPGTYNIILQRRADYSLMLQFKDSNGDEINLTNWSVVAQVWSQDRSEKYADFSIEYISRPGGQVRMTLGFESTTTLPDKAYYDVLLINTSGKREYYLEGRITVSEGYTASP